MTPREVAQVGLVVLLAVLPVAGESEIWQGTYPLGAAGVLAVENVQGSIWVEGWERSEVEVRVELQAPEQLPGLRVMVDRESNSLRFRTVHPSLPAESQGVGTMQVDYRLRVPRQADLWLRTVAGDIVVRDMEGSVDARSLEGRIEQQGLSGPVQARVVTGDVWVGLRRLPEPGSQILLETLDGNIVLQLPPRPQADLELGTVAGRIDSPYWFTTGGAGEEGFSRVRLGHGGTRIRLRAVRGDIRVEERDDLL